jgi:hypothetical protein
MRGFETRVRLFEHEPDLLAWVDPRQRDAATQITVPLIGVPERGEWSYESVLRSDQRTFGVLVLDGLMHRVTTIGGWRESSSSGLGMYSGRSRALIGSRSSTADGSTSMRRRRGSHIWTPSLKGAYASFPGSPASCSAVASIEPARSRCSSQSPGSAQSNCGYSRCFGTWQIAGGDAVVKAPNCPYR